MTDWLGTGARSIRDVAEKIITETIRRIKLQGKNDPNFVPVANDASNILAARHFVLPPPMQERPSNDASDLLANRVFQHADVLFQQGTPLNQPNTLVMRDANGDFAARNIQVVAIVGTTGASYDFVLTKPDGTTVILRVPTTTVNLEALGSLQVATGFGCNGKTPQTAVASVAAGNGVGGAGTVAGTAGVLYTAVEQTIINDLVTTVNAMSAIVNTLATQVSTNATATNTYRTALISDGILS